MIQEVKYKEIPLSQYKQATKRGEPRKDKQKYSFKSIESLNSLMTTESSYIILKALRLRILDNHLSDCRLWQTNGHMPITVSSVLKQH